MRDDRLTVTIKGWKKSGHNGYLATWNGKRRITHKKAKPHNMRPERDWTLEEELEYADMADEVPVMENELVDVFGDVYKVEVEYEEHDWGLDDEYLENRIYLINKYAVQKKGKKWFLGRTRDHVYTMRYSDDGYAIYVFDETPTGTYLLVLQAGGHPYPNLEHRPFIPI